MAESFGERVLFSSVRVICGNPRNEGLVRYRNAVCPVQRGPLGKIVVTELCNVVTLYPAVDGTRPLRSWSFRHKNTFTCPVVFDGSDESLVALQDSKYIKSWKEDEGDVAHLKRKTLPEEALALVPIPGEEPAVLFASGRCELLSEALVTDPDKAEDATHLDCERGKVMWVQGTSRDDRIHVFVVMQQGNDATLYEHVLCQDGTPSVSRLLLSREMGGVRLCGWCLDSTNAHMCLLWSDGRLDFVEDAAFRTICQFPQQVLPPNAVASLDGTRVMLAWLPQQGESRTATSDARLEIWDTRYVVKIATKYLPSSKLTGDCELCVLDGVAYVVSPHVLMGFPFKLRPSTLAGVVGKMWSRPEEGARTHEAGSKKEWQWHEWDLQWNMKKGLVRRHFGPKVSPDENVLKAIMSNTQQSMTTVVQHNLTWVVDKGDLDTIRCVIDQKEGLSEKVIVDILMFFLRSHASKDGQVFQDDVAPLVESILRVPFNDVYLLEQLKRMPWEDVLLLAEYLSHLVRTLPLNSSGDSLSVHQVAEWLSLLLDAHFPAFVSNASANSKVRQFVHSLKDAAELLCGAMEDMAEIDLLLQMINSLPQGGAAAVSSGSLEQEGLYWIEIVDL